MERLHYISLIIDLVWVINIAVVPVSCQDSLSFADWCVQNGKEYSTLGERFRREMIYTNNVELIERLNYQYREREITFAVNQFADITPDEFKHTILMPSFTAQTGSKSPSHYPSLASVPDAFDWRNKSVVTDVKDQGSAKSSWAFSTVGNVEGQWALAGNTLVSLSVEQLVDCDDTYDPNNHHMDCGVFGGQPYLAYQYIMKAGGIESETDYPYCSGKGTCFPCVPKGWNNTRCGHLPTYCNDTFSCHNKLDTSKFVPKLKIKSWKAIEKNETEIVNALVQQGPLSIAINAELLQFYHSGVWNPIVKCDPYSLDHAVLLVGYGTDKGIFGEKPYWLIKNSWGKKWGEDGYFKLIRGKGKCGVDQQVTTAILVPDEYPAHFVLDLYTILSIYHYTSGAIAALPLVYSSIVLTIIIYGIILGLLCPQLRFSKVNSLIYASVQAAVYAMKLAISDVRLITAKPANLKEAFWSKKLIVMIHGFEVSGAPGIVVIFYIVPMLVSFSITTTFRHCFITQTTVSAACISGISGNCLIKENEQTLNCSQLIDNTDRFIDDTLQVVCIHLPNVISGFSAAAGTLLLLKVICTTYLTLMVKLAECRCCVQLKNRNRPTPRKACCCCCFICCLLQIKFIIFYGIGIVILMWWSAGKVDFTHSELFNDLTHPAKWFTSWKFKLSEMFDAEELFYIFWIIMILIFPWYLLKRPQLEYRDLLLQRQDGSMQ